MILGIDPGQRRIGIAEADAETRFARPVEVIDVTLVDPIARIAELVDEKGATLVVVGRPTGLSGTDGPAVGVQQVFVAELKSALEIEVREYDERLTSVIAEQGIRAAGGKKSGRTTLRDAVAAQVMLQGYLDSQR